MNITNKQLRRIIKEELEQVLSEASMTSLDLNDLTASLPALVDEWNKGFQGNLKVISTNRSCYSRKDIYKQTPTACKMNFPVDGLVKALAAGISLNDIGKRIGQPRSDVQKLVLTGGRSHHGSHWEKEKKNAKDGDPDRYAHWSFQTDQSGRLNNINSNSKVKLTQDGKEIGTYDNLNKLFWALKKKYNFNMTAIPILTGLSDKIDEAGNEVVWVANKDIGASSKKRSWWDKITGRNK